MSVPRRARIADQIQRELAELIRTEVRDPRVGMVTVTGVDISRDQSHAKVFFTVLGADPRDATEGLRHAAGFLRTSLARRLTTRSVPELHFEHDTSVERGIRLSQLIDEAVKPSTPARAPRRRPSR
jgi:ribosome-binding factor A